MVGLALKEQTTSANEVIMDKLGSYSATGS
jgi:hypothetical protein